MSTTKTYLLFQYRIWFGVWPRLELTSSKFECIRCVHYPEPRLYKNSSFGKVDIIHACVSPTSDTLPISSLCGNSAAAKNKNKQSATIQQPDTTSNLTHQPKHKQSFNDTIVPPTTNCTNNICAQRHHQQQRWQQQQRQIEPTTIAQPWVWGWKQGSERHWKCALWAPMAYCILHDANQQLQVQLAYWQQCNPPIKSFVGNTSASNHLTTAEAEIDITYHCSCSCPSCWPDGLYASMRCHHLEVRFVGFEVSHPK